MILQRFMIKNHSRRLGTTFVFKLGNRCSIHLSYRGAVPAENTPAAANGKRNADAVGIPARLKPSGLPLNAPVSSRIFKICRKRLAGSLSRPQQHFLTGTATAATAAARWFYEAEKEIPVGWINDDLSYGSIGRHYRPSVVAPIGCA